jgi:predicted hotdog family 3-hydroxylacyl-ACP dehydratase
MLTKSHINSLILHSDSMALIDHVIFWNTNTLHAESTYPDPLLHPLALEGRLSLFCLAEYGAQAMAIHGALTSGEVQKEGYLVALREVVPHVVELPENSGAPLSITAEALHRDTASSSYRFTIKVGEQMLLEGQAMVVVKDTHEAITHGAQ